MTQGNAADTTAAILPVHSVPTLYQRLTAPFESYQHDKRGGAEFDYITGEQCVSRLNEALGVGGWYFRILNREIIAEADEVLVEGELGAFIEGQWVVRTQFGSQKLKRSRQSSQILDVGFDFKGAATDCIKKCASLFGIALHLYEKEPPKSDDARSSRQQPPKSDDVHSSRQQRPADQTGTRVREFRCENCGAPIGEIKFTQHQGTKQEKIVHWTASQLALQGKRTFGMELCDSHFKEAVRMRREGVATADEN